MRFLFLLLLLVLVSAVPAAAETPVFVSAPASPVIVGLGSGQVTLADVNGDGKVDLLTRHPAYGRVRMQYGNGKGSFRPAPILPLFFPYAISDVEVADFNADDIPDLAALRNNVENVAILLGNGKGGWSAAAGSPFATNTALLDLTKPALFVSDVNEDGQLDLIPVNGRRNTFVPLLGDGRGGFVRGTLNELPANEAYYSTEFGDVDGDGHLDAVSALGGSNATPARIVVQRGDGKGGFGAPVAVTTPPLLTEPRVAAVADVDGDKRLDLVLTHNSNHVSVLLQQAEGNFVNAMASPFWVQQQPFSAAVTDVDGDGKVDLLLTMVKQSAPYESWLAVHAWQGKGFLPAAGSPFKTGNGAYNLSVGDVNGDGRVDVAASSFEGVGVTLLLGVAK